MIKTLDFLRKVLLYFIKMATKRNTLFVLFIIMLVTSFFRRPDYEKYIAIFIIFSYFELCDIKDLLEKDRTINVKNNVNTVLHNNSGHDLKIEEAAEGSS
jgi:hypothetical protein